MLNIENPLAHLCLDQPPSLRIDLQEEPVSYLQNLDKEFIDRISQYQQALNMAKKIDQEHFEKIKNSYKFSG